MPVGTVGEDDTVEGQGPGPRGETVGVVGLGQMGLAMATNLLPLMVAGRYEPPAATFRLFQKDLGIIADFARSLDCPTPLLTASLPLYLAALAQGLGDQDTAAVCTVLERLAGEHRL